MRMCCCCWLSWNSKQTFYILVPLIPVTLCYVSNNSDWWYLTYAHARIYARHLCRILLESTKVDFEFLTDTHIGLARDKHSVTHCLIRNVQCKRWLTKKKRNWASMITAVTVCLFLLRWQLFGHHCFLSELFAQQFFVLLNNFDSNFFSLHSVSSANVPRWHSCFLAAASTV